MAEHITRLKDYELTKLLDMLLTADAKKNGINSPGIKVPSNINVPDGGEDGRIKWEAGPEKTAWIPSAFTMFQCKAKDLAPKSCYEEVLLPKEPDSPRKLKPNVEEVVAAGGYYILFTSRQLNEHIMKPRIEKFKEAITDAGFPNYDRILVYDAESIKKWVNEHIAAVTYIQSCLGIHRILNFQLWQDWDSRFTRQNGIPYQTNSQLDEKRALIRSQVEAGRVIRVLGQSGLGKTRMVLETFRGDTDEIKALQQQVVYYDLSMGEVKEIFTFLMSHSKVMTGVIVVDNCSDADHAKICVAAEGGNIGIVTIDFSLNSEERSLIRLDRNEQRDIVAKIIEQNFGNALPQGEKDFLVLLSEGYPQMAALFIKGYAEHGAAGLTEKIPSRYINRLIFAGNEEDPIEYEVIKAISVFSRVGFLHNDHVHLLSPEERAILEEESEFVRTKICAKEVGSREFYRIVRKYLDHILEMRGTSIMVRPTPLAMKLATEFWLNTPRTITVQLLNELKDKNMGIQMVERLSQLDQLDAAKQVVNDVWGPGSPFVNAEVLNTKLGSLLFRYVVEVNPVATLSAIEQSLGSLDKEGFRQIAEGRRNLIWALEKLCFRRETFLGAAKLLFGFAMGENETWANNATNQFIHLFRILLSGTEASLKERLELLHWALGNGDPDAQSLVLKALENGLRSDRFVRLSGADQQGSGPKLKDYHPSGGEIIAYWEAIIGILAEKAMTPGQFQGEAQKILAENINGITRSGKFDLIKDVILAVNKVREDVWQEAISSLKSIVNRDERKSNGFPEKAILDINEVLKELLPLDIKSQLVLKVSKPDWLEAATRIDGMYAGQKAAEDFAVKLITERLEWLPYLGDLLKGEQRQSFSFGRKIAEVFPDRKSLVELTLQLLNEIPAADINPEFLNGLLLGINDPDYFTYVLHRVIEMPHIRHLAFNLTRSFPRAGIKDFMSLFHLVDDFNFPIYHFRVFEFGFQSSTLKNEDVVLFIDKLASYSPEARWLSFAILFSHCFQNAERFNLFKEKFREFILRDNFLLVKDNQHTLRATAWSDCLTKLLGGEPDVALANSVAGQIIQHFNLRESTASLDNTVKAVSKFLLDTYFFDVWDTFGAIFSSHPLAFIKFQFALGGEKNFFGEGGPVLNIWEGERKDFIIEWSRQKPPLVRHRIANVMPFKTREGDTLKWHPFAMDFLANFGNDENVLDQLNANMHSFSSMGSIIPYFRQLQDLFVQLINSELNEVKPWAKAMVERTVIAIKKEQIKEGNEN